MRAVVIDAFGQTPRVRELAEPANVAEMQMRVRVHAAGVNPVDALIAQGVFTPFSITFPYTLGLDFAGVVDEIGWRVRDWQVGDLVYGRAIGTYAEYAAVDANGAIAKIPAVLDFVQAAALPSAAMTALTSVEAAGIAERSRVLIVGATGGVGTFAVQFARRRGAHVIATATDADATYVRELGAHEVVGYTSDDARLPDELDVLLDYASDAPGLTAISRLVRDGGTVISTRYVADAHGLAARRIRAVNVVNRPTAELLHRISASIEDGWLQPPAIRTLALADAAVALAQFASGHVRGKMVLLL